MLPSLDDTPFFKNMSSLAADGAISRAKMEYAVFSELQYSDGEQKNVQEIQHTQQTTPNKRTESEEKVKNREHIIMINSLEMLNIKACMIMI